VSTGNSLQELDRVIEEAEGGNSSLKPSGSSQRESKSQRRRRHRCSSSGSRNVQTDVSETTQQAPSAPSEPETPKYDYTRGYGKGLVTRAVKQLLELLATTEEIGVQFNGEIRGDLGVVKSRIGDGRSALVTPSDSCYMQLLDLIKKIHTQIEEHQAKIEATRQEAERLETLRQEIVEEFGENRMRSWGFSDLLRPIKENYNRSLKRRLALCKETMLTKMPKEIAEAERLETLRQEIVEEFGEDKILECGLKHFLFTPVEAGHNRGLEKHFGYCRRVLSGELEPMVDQIRAWQEIKLRAEELEVKRDEMATSPFYLDIAKDLGRNYDNRGIEVVLETSLDTRNLDPTDVRRLEEAIQTILREEERLENPSSRGRSHVNRDGAWRGRKETTSTAGPAKGSSTGSGDGGKKGLAGGDTRNAKKRRRRHGLTA
jgi:hypothetical protein